MLRELASVTMRKPWASLLACRQLRAQIALHADADVALQIIDHDGIDRDIARAIVERLARTTPEAFEIDDRFVARLANAAGVARTALLDGLAMSLPAQLHCAAALIAIGDPADRPRILDALRAVLVHATAHERAAAASIAARLGATDMLVDVIAMEREPYAWQRELDALAGVDRARAELAHALTVTRASGELQRAAAESFARIGKLANPAAVADAFATAFTDAADVTRTCALRACCSAALAGEAAGLAGGVRLGLASPNGDVVAAACDVVRWHRQLTEIAASHALAVLDSGDRGAKRRAIAILADLRVRGAVEPLLRICETDGPLCAAALEALEDIGDPGAAPRIARLVAAPEVTTRCVAIRVLGPLKHEVAVAALAPLIHDTQSEGWFDVYELAIAALAAIATPAARDVLWQAARLDDPARRDVAMHALMTLGDADATAWWATHGSPLFGMKPY